MGTVSSQITESFNSNAAVNTDVTEVKRNQNDIDSVPVETPKNRSSITEVSYRQQDEEFHSMTLLNCIVDITQVQLRQRRIHELNNDWSCWLYELQLVAHETIRDPPHHLLWKQKCEWRHNWRKRINCLSHLMFSFFVEQFLLTRGSNFPLDNRRRRWKQVARQLSSLFEEPEIQALFNEFTSNGRLFDSFCECFFIWVLLKPYINFPHLDANSAALIGDDNYGRMCLMTYNSSTCLAINQSYTYSLKRRQNMQSEMSVSRTSIEHTNLTNIYRPGALKFD